MLVTTSAGNIFLWQKKIVLSLMKRALICVISGQDGAYLAKLLLEKCYGVYGTSRDAKANFFLGLTRLEIKNQICRAE